MVKVVGTKYVLDDVLHLKQSFWSVIKCHTQDEPPDSTSFKQYRVLLLFMIWNINNLVVCQGKT